MTPGQEFMAIYQQCATKVTVVLSVKEPLMDTSKMDPLNLKSTLKRREAEAGLDGEPAAVAVSAGEKSAPAPAKVVKAAAVDPAALTTAEEAAIKRPAKRSKMLDLINAANAKVDEYKKAWNDSK